MPEKVAPINNPVVIVKNESDKVEVIVSPPASIDMNRPDNHFTVTIRDKINP